ncbi:hypothetical protein [Blautia sp.]|uniref:hypothetical protein n=1 Tax=Blautia sp. TaxID=1955243 RepID=UPI003AB44D32
MMFFLHLPQIRPTGMFPFPGIRHIEDIAQPQSVSGIINQGNPFGAAPDIPAHLFIPEVIFRAGGSVRTLGINHHLLMIRVFVKTGGGG